jgi:hypothetical protein
VLPVVTNQGSTPLKISRVSITGTDHADFIIQQNSCVGTVTAGKSCGVAVVFQPIKAGTRTAVLGISDNGGASPQKAALTGTGK